MSATVTVTLTAEQATALRKALGFYEDNSGRDDIDLACSVLDQIPDNFYKK